MAIKIEGIATTDGEILIVFLLHTFIGSITINLAVDALGDSDIRK